MAHIAGAIIEAAGLTKSFDGKKAVDDLSFSVPKGSLFAFLGQNGAGKSTTINMLIGLLKRDGGEIRFDGKTDLAAMKRNIGVVFQGNTFDDLLTVEENLLLYGRLYSQGGGVKARYREIVSLMGLEGVIKKRFKTLSGGQQRKSEIARAMFTSPSVLFLDEPTTGLDPKTRADVWRILRETREATGMTIFLTTHYMEETADADQVVIIHKGARVFGGTPAELKSRYSHDRMLITPVDAPEFERAAKAGGAEFKKTADTYEVRVDDTAQSIEFLYNIKDNIRFYEVKRGTMDDVFLNAVGEMIEGDANG